MAASELRACRPSGQGLALRRQRGIALLTALLLMLAVLMTSIAAARTAINGARSAQHERDRMLALQGAMAALADAERDIDGGSDPASARAAALAGGTAAAFADGCRGAAPYDGLCAPVSDLGDIAALLADDEGPAVALGGFTGAQMPVGEGAQAAQSPRYLIELLPSPAGALLYRISALGFGSVDTTQVALQAYYLKVLAGGGGGPAPPGPEPAPGQAPDPDPTTGQGPGPAPGGTLPGSIGKAQSGSGGSPGSPGGPGIRVGWREIANWSDIVAGGGT